MSAEIFQFSTAPRRSTTIKTSTRVGEDIGDDLPEEIENSGLPDGKPGKPRRQIDPRPRSTRTFAKSAETFGGQPRP